MAIRIRSGLLAVAATVQAFLDANSVVAKVDVVGWKRRTHHDNRATDGASRIVFSPSDDGGDGGEIVPARFPGPRAIRDEGDVVVADVRALATWNRKLVVCVWGVDLTARESEAAQIEATEALVEWMMRAVHVADGAFAALTWGDVRWTPPGERAFGLEARVGLTLQHPIFDTPREVVYPDDVAVARGTITTPADPGTAGDT